MKKGILILLVAGNAVYAGGPEWTFLPLTATNITVPDNGTAVVEYKVTNQIKKTSKLVMHPIAGVIQDTSGANCKNPFILGYQQSCTLKLNVIGRQLTGNVNGGPIVCEQDDVKCFQPSSKNILKIELVRPITSANITLSGSPLALITNGVVGVITVNNTSSDVSATNITAQLKDTALNGNVIVDDGKCVNIPPLGHCELSFAPLSTPVVSTNFNIQGSNTNAVNASMEIKSGGSLTSVNPSIGSASGGVGITLTGTGLTGATSVLFDGVPATNVNVVNSTTITAVAPAHPVGTVNIQVTGGGSLNNSFTYQETKVGQSAHGGKIACLNGGLNNLIAAESDNSQGAQWGGAGIDTNAISSVDGTDNTKKIVNAVGDNRGVPYAAKICSDYEVDSQGNSPCIAGNACYNDWFLPAGNPDTAPNNQLSCLYDNRELIGGLNNDNYVGSTQWNKPGDAAYFAWYIYFQQGKYYQVTKENPGPGVRCVRLFTPSV